MEKQSISIVVVDPEPAIREILSEVLTDEGYRVVTLDSFDNLLTGLPWRRPDLLLVDIDVPGKRSGIQLLTTLKTDPRTADLPILICTGAVQLEPEILPLLNARDGYRRKPFDLDELLREVARCVRVDRVQPHAA